MTRRVFITGYGIITSIGNNRAENFQSLTSRKCGYGSIDLIDTRHRSLGACEIKHQDAQLAAMASVDENSGFTRTALLGLIAIKEAIQQASLSANELTRSGLISATTTGGIRELEKYYYDLMDASKEGDFTIFTDTANPGEHTERIAETLGIRAYCSTISTACSSSANAIITGAQLIAHHQLDRVICGGAEALSKFTINGFHSLMILSSEQCKPFDQNRSGLNLGEGAAYLGAGIGRCY
jgi:3-oxoacyl-[acyl-carrier-protein] synthase-1